jgi:hypothetical protein
MRETLMVVTLILSFAQQAMAQFAPNPEIVEENVLLLWNPADAESNAIAAAYLAAHPDVISFPIDDGIGTPGISYSYYLPNSQPNQFCTDCTGPEC